MFIFIFHLEILKNCDKTEDNVDLVVIMDINNETPSKTTIKNKVITQQMNCDSPFRYLPNTSTPPSRCARIINPFDSHLLERLHLPTFRYLIF